MAFARFGIVLARGGGALGKLETLTRLFLGGPVGNGRQWFSWIHRSDLVEAILFLLERPDVTGAVNCCAPEPVRQWEFAKALGRHLRRPAITPAPAFALRLLLGEFADTLLFSQRMVPKRLLLEGFKFKYPEAILALEDLYGQ